MIPCAMSPIPLLRRRLPSIAAGLLVVALVLTGCSAQPFDPASPCTADGRAPGAYPALEAMVPRSLRGTPPSRVDSGRTCTPASLGSLAANGVNELRFAGSIWDLGADSGVTLGVFEADELDIDWVETFFESGARAAKNTEHVDVGTTQLPDTTTAFRLDTLNGESYQTVVVWPDGKRVRVAIAASSVRRVKSKADHEALVRDALAAAFPDVAAQGG
jgi:hypothetical protein